MGGEFRRMEICFTTLSTDNLPDGMYADDVAAEISSIVNGILTAWYETRGKLYLACEPMMSGSDRRCDFVGSDRTPCLLHRGHIRSHWPPELPEIPQIEFSRPVVVTSDTVAYDDAKKTITRLVQFEE